MRKYQSYKPSGVEWIGEIPEHWKFIKFSYLISKSDLGGNYESSTEGDGVPLMKMGNLGRGQIVLNKIEYLNSFDVYDTNHKLEYGDFLFNTRNSIDLVGKVSLWRNELDFSLYNSNILRISFKKGVDNEFMCYLFNSQSILDVLKLISKGTTSVSGIYYKDLSEIKICIPSIEEQLQIVEFLDSKTELIDKIIKCLENRKELLKEKRLVLIEKVLLDKKIERIRLMYVVDLVNRPISEFETTKFTRIGMYNWGRGLFKYEEEIGSELGDSEFSFIKEGDLILSGQFSWEGSVSIVESEFDNCIVSHRFHILNGKNNILLNEYLWGYFTSQEGHFLLDSNSNGFVGRNRPLNIKKLLKEKIPIPNIEIQNEIKNIVEIERKYYDYSQKMKSLLNEYRQSLISEVVTGKIKVTN